ncbi:hypothetical protein [Roseivirga seohaensis]|uniref:hypothetical protein n=1 Tax=Roseivirga seohaensis TaxID=1914963 RepID=UPI003BA904DB
MKGIDRKVNMPSYLHELHGTRASVFDLLLTYTVAFITTIVVLFQAWELNLSVFKLIILGILVLDLSGGVVSNFTEGTNEYYAEKPKMRYVFIGLHVLQPILLTWLFPDDVFGIAVISIYTLIAMIIVNSVGGYLKQRVLGAFLMVIGLSVSFLVSAIQPMVHLMLILFVIKLILAFAVRWK